MVGRIEKNNLNPEELVHPITPFEILKAIYAIDNVIQITFDVNIVLERLMEEVLKIFKASRSWLFYPCDPELPSFDVTFESATPEYPGAKALNQKVPMTDDMADYCKRALSAADGLDIDPPVGETIKNDIAIRFNVKSMMFMAIRPKSGEPWMFGLHQCDRNRVWTKEEQLLFHMIGKRITTCLDNLLYVRQLKESEAKYRNSLNSVKESDKRFRLAFMTSPDSINISSLEDGIFIDVNEGFTRTMGYSPDEVIGKTSIALNMWKNPEDRKRLVKRLKEKGAVENLEAEFIVKDGRIIYGLMSARKITLNNEKVILSIIRDITERKKVEHALQRSEKELKKSETKYRTMMEAIKDPVYICSEDYKIQYMNQAMIDRIGYDATGKVCYEALHGFDKICHWCTYEETFRRGCSEKNIISPLDNRSFNISSTVFVNERGSLSKLSVFRDTTELIELQNRLQQAQKMEAIGNLAGGIAHDFNNILFPIIGMSEMMMEDLPAGSLELEYANEINKAGHRAKELVSQILAFSRQSDQDKIPIRFQSILKEVLKLCRSTIPANITIAQKIERNCGVVRGNATQLHQIAMNLITNAYHAVQEKNGTILVALEEIKINLTNLTNTIINPGTYLMLTVSDDGTGMTKKLKNKIFEPYFTTKEEGKGTGLGLAVVYGIVKDYGGGIDVETEIGCGTTFRVYLPLIGESEDKENTETKTELETGHEHILLVDDEAAVIRLEQQMLERLGYQITSRTSSLDALNLFRSNPDDFDLIVSDMTMPNMTGDHLAKELLSIRPDIPIIICTGFSESINKKQAEAIGIKGLLMKPVVKSDMAKEIRRILD
ncbi:hybrid sensor histidine kinase/response regulator [Desulfobacter latus]|uniref:histidine kinase n=1 Tax=Desulfobacter latus TaxID=2292 RepID=A0A850T9P8_9BACT|nr:PAS domain S-box protein [Desulfobacter latus]NWH05268.1 PAS domain S-box protein [Desulfobacter latus]